MIATEENTVYILLCGDGSYYCGWTNHLAKRLETHQKGKGAKYTRARLPVSLVYYETFPTKKEAMSREWHLKRLTHQEKENLARQWRESRGLEFTFCSSSVEGE